MAENADHAQIALPPPLIFLGYLVSALILNWAVPFPTPWTMVLRLVGGALVIAGIWLVSSAISQIRNARTTLDPRGTTTAIITGGPYRFTRNPIYLGFFFIYLGFTLFAGTLWGLLLSPFLIGTVTQSIIHAEEAYLKKKFEKEYTEYSSRVRRWL
jgi:protein-S-isoprenylcysteine O-methyltransferase Ste14